MKATQFFIGFGPTVWSVRRGETEYGIKALPLGGFVKILGMTSIDDVDPADEPRTLRRKPAWQRVIVLAAGSFMHFALASVLLFGLAMIIGIENDDTPRLGTISDCLPASATALNNHAPCPSGAAKSPAGVAGLRVGDEVTSFNGVKVSNFTQFTAAIKKAKAGETVPLTVVRDGKPLTLHVTPAAVPGRSGGFLGIGGTAVFQPAGPVGALRFVGAGWGQIGGSVAAFGHLPSEIPRLFDKNAASSGSDVTSMVGVAQVTGQVVAAPISWQAKVSDIVQIVAEINIFVGVFNLLPLLPLDGGHIFAVFLERIRAWFARIRRRPDPGLFDIRKLIPVSFGIFAIVVALSVMVLIANLVNPVRIG
jgi:membrane-associated protease RseP (regulator of RpoE activity)